MQVNITVEFETVSDFNKRTDNIGNSPFVNMHNGTFVVFGMNQDFVTVHQHTCV